MEFIYFTEKEKHERREELFAMTVRSDREFVPPLSMRDSTVQKDLTGHVPAEVSSGNAEDAVRSYFNEMLAQEIIAAVEDGKVNAFLSFRKDFTNEVIGPGTLPNLYLSTLISRPEARGKGIGRQIFSHLFRNHFPTRRVFTRTWSTNDVQLHVFEKLGFRELKRVKDGRGPGIDTIYFEKPAEYENPANPDLSYDVVVAGGGFTGCAAALAAARLGKKVVLIEAGGALGGAANHALVFPFMPYYTTVEKEDGTKEKFYLSRGLFTEFTDELTKNGAYSMDKRFDTETLKRLLDRKLTEAGVKVLFHGTVYQVEKDGTTLKSVAVATKAGTLRFFGKAFIDCTGDADLTALSGVPVRLGREPDHLCQPMTLCFRVVNADKKTFFGSRPLYQALYKEWLAEGRTSNPRENVLVFDYPVEGVLHFNTTRVVKLNPVDPFDLSAAEMEARKQVEEFMAFLREKHVPGMEKAELLSTADSIGVRESRMLCGAYTLTGKDLVDCTKFEDAIAAGNYDIDIHNPEGSGTSHYYFPAGTWYTIPYRALTPKAEDADNLLVAGRALSADHEAQASIRIMPICCTTGEAAGVAASVAIDEGVRVQDANVSRIQKILKENGAFIG